jgi:hypothetical protein
MLVFKTDQVVVYLIPIEVIRIDAFGEMEIRTSWVMFSLSSLPQELTVWILYAGKGTIPYRSVHSHLTGVFLPVIEVTRIDIFSDIPSL